MEHYPHGSFENNILFSAQISYACVSNFGGGLVIDETP